MVKNFFLHTAFSQRKAWNFIRGEKLAEDITGRESLRDNDLAGTLPDLCGRRVRCFCTRFKALPARLLRLIFPILVRRDQVRGIFFTRSHL